MKIVPDYVYGDLCYLTSLFLELVNRKSNVQTVHPDSSGISTPFLIYTLDLFSFCLP